MQMCEAVEDEWMKNNGKEKKGREREKISTTIRIVGLEGDYTNICSSVHR